MPTGLFNVAFSDDVFVADPDWTRLDADYVVAEITTNRGRSYELEKTDTGTAVVKMIDLNGDLDPLNTGGAFYGSILPLKQAAISLQNADTGTWETIFRGFIREWRCEPHPTEQILFVTIELVDALELFAAWELLPDFPPGQQSLHYDLYFAEDDALDAMRSRLNSVLDDIGWPASLREIFSGNVGLQEVTYPPRTTVLTVLQDAVDAEFPGVANLYVQRDGRVTAHGRYARFQWETVEYHIAEWSLGDQGAADADPTEVVPLTPPIAYGLDTSSLYTSAFCTPQARQLNEKDLTAQSTYDSGAALAYGFRTWSAEGLLTLRGEDATGAEETRKFADYYRGNFSQPLLRVGILTVKSQDPDSVYGPATWELLTRVDISDVVYLYTTHVGGGGFTGHRFYVESVAYRIVPHTAEHPYVEMSLDVSPAGHYDYSPFVG